jgi:hypothetical protein
MFKGHPILTLNPSEKYPFSFGLAKAQLFLANYEQVKKFVETYALKAG